MIATKRESMKTKAANPPIDLPARLGGVRVGLREDLDVTRHVFRGVPSYIVRDPVTFESRRFDPRDYEIFVSIRVDRSLGETFEHLVGSGKLERADEDGFYEFVLTLHRMSFLRLPIADDAVLYKRFKARRRGKRAEVAKSLLFLRVPLLNPNAFLERTMPLVRPLFSPIAVALWFALVAAAGFVVLSRFDELSSPLQGVLAAGNLPVLWTTLILLKIVHEFGHAYACRYFGGHVPEMGAYFILLTPCAYVDATSSWGFTRKRDRIAVALAGMYVEGAVAALATLIWASSSPGIVQSVAFNVMLLASLITILFNANPLMRYDGYYMLSDWLEIPNLRSRAVQYVKDLAKHIFLGLPRPRSVGDARLGSMLFSYGVGAAIYRTLLVVTIGGLLATKFKLVGAMAGGLMIGGFVLRSMIRLVGFLCHAPETAGVRVRAVGLGVVVLIIVPALLMIVPLPRRATAEGVVRREHRATIHARVGGELDTVPPPPGSRVQLGATMCSLRNFDLAASLDEASAALAVAEARAESVRGSDPAAFAQELDRVEAAKATLRHLQRAASDLACTAPIAGTVIDAPSPRDVGRFFARGEPIATVAGGVWQVRTELMGDAFASIRPAVGDIAEFRAVALGGSSFAVSVVSVSPKGTRYMDDPTFTHLTGGEIAVDPRSGMAAEPYFEVVLRFVDSPPEVGASGVRGHVRFDAGRETVSSIVVHGLLRFWQKLRRS